MPPLPADFHQELGFIAHRPGEPETINADSFDDDVLHASLPVLVEFWAARCGPCRRLAPDLAAVARQFHGQLHVFTLNVDEELEAAQRFNVWSIPAVLRFDNGHETARLVGERISLPLLVDLVQHPEIEGD